MININKSDIVVYKNKLYVVNEIKNGRVKLFWLDEPKFFWTDLSSIKLYQKRNDKALNLNIKNIPNNQFTKLDYCPYCDKHNLISGLKCEVDPEIIH